MSKKRIEKRITRVSNQPSNNNKIVVENDEKFCFFLFFFLLNFDAINKGLDIIGTGFGRFGLHNIGRSQGSNPRTIFLYFFVCLLSSF